MIKEKIKKRKGTIQTKKGNEADVPYEQKVTIIPLYLFFVIVDHGQANFFLDGFSELGVSMSLALLGKGTAPQELYDMLSLTGKKDIVLGVVKEPDLERVSDFVRDRFAVSKKAKGIAFSTKINSMVGVLVYKFLTNSRDYRLKSNDAKKEKK